MYHAYSLQEKNNYTCVLQLIYHKHAQVHLFILDVIQIIIENLLFVSETKIH